VTFDYCWFWDGEGEPPFKKSTDIWTNSPKLIEMLSGFTCDQNHFCPHFKLHTPVAGNTAEATPFPRRLAETIAQAISFDASPQRKRPLAPAGADASCGCAPGHG
jgi:hypothetical protein